MDFLDSLSLYETVNMVNDRPHVVIGVACRVIRVSHPQLVHRKQVEMSGQQRKNRRPGD